VLTIDLVSDKKDKVGSVKVESEWFPTFNKKSAVAQLSDSKLSNN